MYDYDFAKFIPTVTPLDPLGEPDLKSLGRLASYQAAIPGVADLVSRARIGEGTVLKPEEKLKVYEVMGAAAHEHGKVHTAGIAPQSTREAIELERALEKLPVDAAMISPPLLFAWGKVGGELKFKNSNSIHRCGPSPETTASSAGAISLERWEPSLAWRTWPRPSGRSLIALAASAISSEQSRYKQDSLHLAI